MMPNINTPEYYDALLQQFLRQIVELRPKIDLSIQNGQFLDKYCNEIIACHLPYLQQRGCYSFKAEPVDQKIGALILTMHPERTTDQRQLRTIIDHLSDVENSSLSTIQTLSLFSYFIRYFKDLPVVNENIYHIANLLYPFSTNTAHLWLYDPMCLNQEFLTQILYPIYQPLTPASNAIYHVTSSVYTRLMRYIDKHVELTKSPEEENQLLDRLLFILHILYLFYVQAIFDQHKTSAEGDNFMTAATIVNRHIRRLIEWKLFS